MSERPCSANSTDPLRLRLDPSPQTRTNSLTLCVSRAARCQMDPETGPESEPAAASLLAARMLTLMRGWGEEATANAVPEVKPGWLAGVECRAQRIG